MEDRSREAHTAYLQIIFGMKFRQYHVALALQKADMITISKKKAVSEAHFGSINLHFLPPSPLCNHKSVINNIKGRARNVMLERKHMAALLETGKFFQDRLYVNCIVVSFYYTLSTERI